MTLPQRPMAVIAPVVLNNVGIRDRAHELLGTCFQVGSDLFMSANHVFGITPPSGMEISVVLHDNDPITTYRTELLYSHPRLDIAVARVKGWPVDEPFVISQATSLAMNADVLTVEYSPTKTQVPLPDGRESMPIAANWHKGNIVREYRADFGARYIDLSYPALKGASGAPVIQEATGHVLGMVIGNVEQQFLPAQIERTEHADGGADVIARYFLPSAQAFRECHLAEVLSHVGDASS